MTLFLGAFYQYTVAIILVLLIVLLFYLTCPVFSPILWFITAVFLPILFSTFLYYALRPIVNFLDRWMPRLFSILLTYSLILIPAALTLLLFVPEAIDVISQTPSEKLKSIQENLQNFINNFKIPISNLPHAEEVLVEYLPKINAFLYARLGNLFTTLANITISLALTPFVLFYFLRDDALFSRALLRFVPQQFQDEVTKIIQDIDGTLSEFILAQLTIAGVVGSFLFCGYLAIGLPHALLLALFAMIFYMIPVLGSLIGVIPALFVGLSLNFSMALKVLLVMGIAHLLEANLLTPRLMAQRLKIHPLTLILLLVAAGTLYGIFGLLLVTPTYAILKVITWNLYKIFRLRYALAKHQEIKNEH